MSFPDLERLLRQNGINVANDVKNKSSGSGNFSNPRQRTLPDVAPLVNELLSKAGIKINPAPKPMKIPSGMVTIFDGPHKGYGCLRRYCHRGCCALVLTKNGMVEIPVNHLTIHC
jgi:hypothetical protein